MTTTKRKTLKLSGKMIAVPLKQDHSADDTPQTFAHIRPDGRTVRVTVPADDADNDRITSLKQVMTHVDSLLSAAYQSTCDGMLPPQVSDARKALQKAIREG
jgi:hypothetical protein